MQELRFAVKNTIPIFFTYLFIGIAFGVLMSDENAALMADPMIDFMMAPEEALSSLPPTMILGGSKCPFRFQNLDQGRRLAELGVEVTMKIFPGAVHGFIPHFMPCWKEAAAMIVKAIRNTSL